MIWRDIRCVCQCSLSLAAPWRAALMSSWLKIASCTPRAVVASVPGKDLGYGGARSQVNPCVLAWGQ